MKPFSANVVMIAVSLVASAMLLASCGSSESTTVTNRMVSQAQAEADLKRALDAGAISQSEYEKELDELRDGD